MERELLIVATKKFVCALNPLDGSEIWRTTLPGVNGSVISILIRGDEIFAGSTGRVICLDRVSGGILWVNELPGMGFQHVILAMEGAPAADPSAIIAAAEENQRAQDSAAGGAAAIT